MENNDRYQASATSCAAGILVGSITGVASVRGPAFAISLYERGVGIAAFPLDKLDLIVASYVSGFLALLSLLRRFGEFYT